MKQNLKIIGSIILIIPALIWVYRTFFKTTPLLEKSPNEAEKVKVEAELAQVEKELDELNGKVYSDEEIIKKFTE